MSRKRNTFEHWQVVAAYLMIYDILAVNLSYLFVLWMRFDCAFSQIPPVYLQTFLKIAPWHTAFSLLVFWLLRLYKSIWRYAGYSELLRVTAATAATGVFYIAVLTVFREKMPVSCYLFGPLVQFCLTVGIRFSYRFITLERIRREKSENDSDKRILLIGAGNAGKLILRDIIRSKEDVGTVKCIIDDDPNKWGRYMEGVPIAGGRDDILVSVEKYHINEILLAIPTASPEQRRDILDICKETGCEIKTLPGVYQMVSGEVSMSQMKQVAIEDLLGRETIKVNMEEIFRYLKGKTILVTGGGGSIGSELCRQIAGHEPKQLIIFDIYENNAYEIEQELKRKHPNLNLVVLIGSVRDESMRKFL